MERFPPLLPVVLAICLLCAAGCSQPASPGPRSTTVATPVTTITPVPTTGTPSLSPAPSAVAATPTIPDSCTALASAAADDKAFLDLVINNDIERKLDYLGKNSCRGYSAAALNGILVKGPKPKTPALTEARKYLVSATTWCQVIDSSSAGRTADDYAKAESLIKEFRESAAPCQQVLPYSLAAPGPASSNLTFSGSGNGRKGFKAIGGGATAFRFTHAGNGTFTMVIENSNGQMVHDISLAANTTSGMTGYNLQPGDYVLRILADGPWTIGIS